MRLPRADNWECIRMTEEERPDPGSRASPPPTTCRVFLGWLQGEGHLEPLNQFNQEELVLYRYSIPKGGFDIPHSKILL